MFLWCSRKWWLFLLKQVYSNRNDCYQYSDSGYDSNNYTNCNSGVAAIGAVQSKPDSPAGYMYIYKTQKCIKGILSKQELLWMFNIYLYGVTFLPTPTFPLAKVTLNLNGQWSVSRVWKVKFSFILSESDNC